MWGFPLVMFVRKRENQRINVVNQIKMNKLFRVATAAIYMVIKYFNALRRFVLIVKNKDTRRYHVKLKRKQLVDESISENKSSCRNPVNDTMNFAIIKFLIRI